MFDTRLRTLKSKRHQRLALSQQSRSPEVAGHLHLIERHGAKWVIGRSPCTGEQGEE